MALPSKLTSPMATTAVNDPELAAQLNIDLNHQLITNPGATATVDPTLGGLIRINTTTVGTTIALTALASRAGTLQDGARVTVQINSSGATPTLTAGTGFHLTSAGAISLTQNKVCVLELRYDTVDNELKQVAALAVLS